MGNVQDQDLCSGSGTKTFISFYFERYLEQLQKFFHTVNYLFVGIPIFNALRFIISISATKLTEIKAPTRNVALNAMAFGTEDVTPSGLCTFEVNNAMNIPAITGPIAPPIIRIVE